MKTLLLPLLARAYLRHWRRHPAQAFLAFLGLALGVAVAVAVELTGGSAEASFRESSRALQSGATHHLEGGPAGLDLSAYLEVRAWADSVNSERPERGGAGEAGERDAAASRGHGEAERSMDGAAGRVAVAPMIEGLGFLEVEDLASRRAAGGSRAGQARDSLPLRLLGFDPLADPAVNALLSAPEEPSGRKSGDGPGVGPAGHPGPDPMTLLGLLLTVPRGILLSARLGERLGLEPGDTLHYRSGRIRAALVVAGFLGPPGGKSPKALESAWEGTLLCDIATAQEVLGLQDRFTRLNLHLPPPEEGGRELEQSLLSRIPPHFAFLTAGERIASVARMGDAFRMNLRALSLLALLVGAFLVYNTLSFAVLRRRPLIGRLRALGVTAREVLGLCLGEAFLAALLACAAGLAGGVLLARALVSAVARTYTDLYFPVTVTRLYLTPLLFAEALLLGLGAGLLAAWIPAREAARVRPGSLLLRSLEEEGGRGRFLRLAGLGLLLLIAGALLLLPPKEAFPASSPLPLLLGFAAFSLGVLGFAFAVPGLLSLLAAASTGLAHRLPFRRPRFALLHASQGVSRSLRRTGIAAAALSLAVSVTLSMDLLTEGFRRTVETWLGHTLEADLYLSTPEMVQSRTEAALPAGLAERMAALPGLRGLGTYRSVLLPVGAGGGRVADSGAPGGRGEEPLGRAGRLHLLALGLPADTSLGRRVFRFLGAVPHGPAAEGAGGLWARFDRDCGLLVSEPFRYRHGVGAGAKLSLPTRSGVRDFPVLAVYRDYGNERGTVAMSRKCYIDHFGDSTLTSLALYAEDPRRLASALAPEMTEAGLLLRSNGALKEASLEVFDRTFAITRLLRHLAIGVAALGTLSALMALLLEKARETALLRALGFTPFQTGALSSLEALLLGLASGLLALPLGLAEAVFLVQVLNRRSFGWTLDMDWSAGPFLEALLLAVGAALLAGLLPALAAARVRVSELLRND